MGAQLGLLEGLVVSNPLGADLGTPLGTPAGGADGPLLGIADGAMLRATVGIISADLAPDPRANLALLLIAACVLIVIRPHFAVQGHGETDALSSDAPDVSLGPADPDVSRLISPRRDAAADLCGE